MVLIYLYRCHTCEKDFDVWKPVAEFNRAERCEACQSIAERVICPPRGLLNTAVEHPTFDAALGTVVKDKNHRSAIAKSRGLIEVGNESPETVHKEMGRTLNDKLSYSNVKISNEDLQ